MVRAKQCFSVVRNIIWLTCTGFCLLLTPSELLAETEPMPFVLSHDKLLPVPSGYACPPNALSCVTSEDAIRFLPGDELSLPARFLMRSPDDLMPVYYLNKKNSGYNSGYENSDDDKILPQNGEAIHYLKVQFEIMTSKNIIVITPAEAGTWKLLRLNLHPKLADDTWGSIQNSILVPRGEVAVLQKIRGNLTLTVQLFGDNRPANGVIIDSEGVVFRGDDTSWLSNPEDSGKNDKSYSNEVTGGRSYSSAVRSKKTSSPGNLVTIGAGGGTSGAGGDDGEDDDWKKRQKKADGAERAFMHVTDEELEKQSLKTLRGYLHYLRSNEKDMANTIVNIIINKNENAKNSNKMGRSTVLDLMDFLRRHKFNRNTSLMSRLNSQVNAKK